MTPKHWKSYVDGIYYISRILIKFMAPTFLVRLIRNKFYCKPYYFEIDSSGGQDWETKSIGSTDRPTGSFPPMFGLIYSSPVNQKVPEGLLFESFERVLFVASSSRKRIMILLWIAQGSSFQAFFASRGGFGRRRTRTTTTRRAKKTRSTLLSLRMTIWQTSASFENEFESSEVRGIWMQRIILWGNFNQLGRWMNSASLVQVFSVQFLTQRLGEKIPWWTVFLRDVNPKEAKLAVLSSHKNKSNDSFAIITHPKQQSFPKSSKPSPNMRCRRRLSNNCRYYGTALLFHFQATTNHGSFYQPTTKFLKRAPKIDRQQQQQQQIPTFKVKALQSSNQGGEAQSVLRTEITANQKHAWAKLECRAKCWF